MAQSLRRYATSRTVPGSISGGVTGFFSDIFPSDRTMALGSTQLLVKMSTRNIPGGKGSRCVRLTTSPPSRAEFHEIWEPKPPGTLWVTPGLLRDSFTFFTLYDVRATTKSPNDAFGLVGTVSKPSTPAVDSRKARQYPRLHIQFYKLLMLGGNTARNM